jgi:hypothetical protein
LTLTHNPDRALRVCQKYFGENEGRKLYELHALLPDSTPNSIDYLALTDEEIFQEFREILISKTPEKFEHDGNPFPVWYQNWMLNATTLSEADTVGPASSASQSKTVELELEGYWSFRYEREGLWRTNGMWARSHEFRSTPLNGDDAKRQ